MKKTLNRIKQAVADALHEKTPARRFFFNLYFFLFAVEAGLFVMLILGNFQQFLDRSQLLILSALSVTVFLNLLCGVFPVIFSLATNTRPVFPTRARFVLFTISFILSFLVFLILQFFNVWLFG